MFRVRPILVSDTTLCTIFFLSKMYDVQYETASPLHITGDRLTRRGFLLETGLCTVVI
jgi:hypothetical protein